MFRAPESRAHAILRTRHQSTMRGTRLLHRQHHHWRNAFWKRSAAYGALFVGAAGGIGAYGCTEHGQTYVHAFRPLRMDSPPNNWSKEQPVIGSHVRSFREEELRADEKELQKEAHEGYPGEQSPPSQKRAAVDGEEKDVSELSAWDDFSAKVTSLPQTVYTLGDTITGYIVPEWVKVLPGFVTKLQNELSMAPGSLAQEVWWEANDPEINPEIIWEARVRVSNELCDEEKKFLHKRKQYVRQALARYLDIDEEEIHPEDVPTIAMCGSGGGLRALVAGTSSYLSAAESGLFDCVTYTAGVSGSCWLQTLFYSSLAGQSHERLINHLKNRLNVHIAFPPPALAMISSAPTNKYLLSGLIEKLKGVPDADFGLVDVYGLLLAARLMVPKGELRLDDQDLKISNQRRFVDGGAYPLPIYTAVRHEIPLERQDQEDKQKARAQARREAWFQWFEYTPYEFWCEELEAGIPTWAIGRRFHQGKTVWRDNGLALPELRVPLMMGIWGSAFCATLSHYYKEIRPILSGLAGFAGLDQMIVERNDELVKMHPIDPAVIPNYALGMRDSLPPSCPESLFSESNLQLMDAGMSNNLPIYPLLRPGRDVDVMIAFDASADVKTDNWLKVADGYAKQRGIKGWPVGAGWPPADASEQEIAEELEAAQANTEQKASDKLAEAQERQHAEDDKKPRGKKHKHEDLGYCNVWVGSTEERVRDEEPPIPKRVEEEWELMRSDAGIAVVYFPFLANPKVEGVDPRTSDFMSTWNFVYTPQDIDKVVALARANFEEGNEQTKRTVRAVYERKKARRLEREQLERARRRQWQLRMGRVWKGEQGDHFT